VREPEDGRPDLLGAAELALGIGVLTLGIVKGSDWGWTDARTLGSFAAALALTAAFVVRSSHHEAPVIELPLLRVRSFAVERREGSGGSEDLHEVLPILRHPPLRSHLLPRRRFR